MCVLTCNSNLTFLMKNNLTMRQQCRLKISKTAVLICMPRNMACVGKETGLLRLSVRKHSVAGCFKAVIHEVFSVERSHQMIQREGDPSIPAGDSPCMQSHEKPYSKEIC